MIIEYNLADCSVEGEEYDCFQGLLKRREEERVVQTSHGDNGIVDVLYG